MRVPGGINASPFLKLEKEALLEKQRNEQEKLHERLSSVSSTRNSSSSDQSSSSEGMLHCKWKGAIPYFVFSVDDQREVYTAYLWKLGSPNDKGLGHIYSFHSQSYGQKELGGFDNLLHYVGKMKVSSSYIQCPNSSKFMETEFVLFGENEHHPSEIQSLTSPTKNNSWLSKKVVDAFRTSHPSKDNSRPKGTTPRYIYEDHTGDFFLELLGEPDALDFTLLQSNLLPDLELAAIVVRERVHDDTCQEASVGSWGLKFVEKVRAKQANYDPVGDLESSENSQESSRNRNDYSMDALIPAGFHGGPRTMNGGPSSLTMRWRSGGHCDCGGWDIGCPLTVLHNLQRKEVLPQLDAQVGECKSFDLFMEGAKQGETTLRMVNIRDGLYFIHFQSTLTALQAFSIGVAILHNQSSGLCPKDEMKLKQQEPRTTIL